MKIKSQKDFFSGLLFMVAGITFAVGATKYGVGSAARMGPGYFPLVLGVLLGVIGLVLTFGALVLESEEGGRLGPAAWKPLVFITGANLAFGILLAGLPALHVPAMGLVVAVYALTFVAACADDRFELKEVAVLGTVLAAGSYLGLIWLLKLPLPVWPGFVTG